ncbi:MAG: PAS domain-containing protein [Burkholderiaceae bacterium]|nr:PAS domain-containing protein [Burkholderiaceae bacterium]
MNDPRQSMQQLNADTGDAAQMRARAMAALRLGEFDLAEQAIARGDATLAELVENLRIYQIELQMQSEELQRSHARTQQALDRFTLLFARLPVPALLMDANGVVIESNHRAEETFGLSSAMMRGYLFHRLVDADDYQAEVRSALLDARSAGQAEVAAVRFRARGDAQMVGDLHAESLTDPVSGALQYVCVIIDRTQQMADLEQLQASLARLRARDDDLADPRPSAALAPLRLVADAQGRVQWADAVLAALGLAPGARLDALLPRLSADEARTLAAAMADGSAVELTLSASPLTLRPVRDVSGAVLQWLGSSAAERTPERAQR